MKDTLEEAQANFTIPQTWAKAYANKSRLWVSILVCGPMGRVLEKHMSTLYLDGVVDGLVRYGVE